MTRTPNYQEILTLFRSIASGETKVFTYDSRNWFDIINEISSWMLYYTDSGYIFYIHNDCNELDTITGIRKVENYDSLSDSEHINLTDEIFYSSNLDIESNELIKELGLKYFDFVSALQNATKPKDISEEDFILLKIKFSKLGEVFLIENTSKDLKKFSNSIKIIKCLAEDANDIELQYYSKLALNYLEKNKI